MTGLKRVVVVLAMLTFEITNLSGNEGFHLQPQIGYFNGHHKITLPMELRYGWEYWKAFAPEADAFNGLLARVADDAYQFGEYADSGPTTGATRESSITRWS